MATSPNMTTTSNSTGPLLPGKPTPFGPRVYDWNIRNTTYTTSAPFPPTKTTNGIQTGNTISTDVDRPDTIDFGRKTSTHVPPPPPTAASTSMAASVVATPHYSLGKPYNEPCTPQDDASLLRAKRHSGRRNNPPNLSRSGSSPVASPTHGRDYPRTP